MVKVNKIASAPHALPLERLLHQLGSNPKRGLSREEAERRLKEGGANELVGEEGPTTLCLFFRQLSSPLVWILLIATLLSAWIDYNDYLEKGGVLIAHLADALVILLIVLLNTAIGFFQEYRAENSINALKGLLAKEAVVVREGVKQTILARELVPGDLLIIGEGEKVSADCRLIAAYQLKAEEAPLTGESEPVAKCCREIDEEAPVAERKNMLFSGSSILSGRGEALVVATGMETEFGKIAKTLQTTEKEATPLQRQLKKLAFVIGGAVLFIAIALFVAGAAREYMGGNLNVETLRKLFMVAVAVAVAAIPEGLPAVVTIALGRGVQRMAERNAIVRVLPSVETLGSVTVICSDKTGTLTHNKMTVTKIWSSGRCYSVEGSGYEAKGAITFQGERARLSSLEKILTIGALCNDAEFDGEMQLLGDPTEGSLIISALKGGVDRKELLKCYPRVFEIPFSSERKLMTTIHEIDGKRVSFTKGAVDQLLARAKWIDVDGDIEPLTDEWKERILQKNEEYAKGALRVLAFATRDEIDDGRWQEAEEELCFVGMQAMVDPPRAGVMEAIERCRGAGIRIVMITGDHLHTARAIAAELQLTGKAVDGSKLGEIDLDEEVEEISIYARVNPIDKLKIVEALQKKNHIVAMTGDGVNDAPALKKADIGIAMAVSGTDVSKEAADMLLADDNFTTIVNAVEEGRGIYGNIRKFFAFLISGNIAEVGVIFGAICVGLPLPLTAILILVINLVTDGLPATALSVDPFEPGAMQQPPRPPNQPIYAGLFPYIAIYPLIVTASVLFLFAAYYFSTGDLTKAETVSFFSLAMFELFQAYAVRSTTLPSLRVGLAKNRPLLAATASSLIICLSIIYIPAMQEIFGTTALQVGDLFLCTAFASIGFLYLELAKAFSSKSR